MLFLQRVAHTNNLEAGLFADPGITVCCDTPFHWLYYTTFLSVAPLFPCLHVFAFFGMVDFARVAGGNQPKIFVGVELVDDFVT